MTTRWHPFAEIAWRPDGDTGFTPPVDIFEEDEAVLVRVELPGVRPEDVVVDATARLLTIRGERRLEHAQRREGYHRLERRHGAFARAFALPGSVAGENAVAIMNDGVLTVRIPKRRARSTDTFAA